MHSLNILEGVNQLILYNTVDKEANGFKVGMNKHKLKVRRGY